MGKYIKIFKTHSAYKTYIEGNNKILPNVSCCLQEIDTHYNPQPLSESYLTFVALEDTTFTLSENAVSYSLDGILWSLLTAGTPSTTVKAGNSIMWKGNLTPNSSNGIGTFSSTGRFDVKGNPMSLLYGDNFKGQTDLTGKNYAFKTLFSNSSVVNAKDLSLPATTLANQCYSFMFFNCTSLATAPELPATTLTNECYSYMFRDCSSLTTAPELPATTLESGCYLNMFEDCTNLNYIKAMFTTTPGNSYTSNWVRGVAAIGTFVKNSAASWDVTGINGIPSGWTVQTASA